ncbi:MAG: carboxypeptidase-like regulatory domain-containing protein [Spirochaetales bacterium]|nr:carboxypeptidase-like regulatory domain-containing protein [Spirochaetales bacterium]
MKWCIVLFLLWGCSSFHGSISSPEDFDEADCLGIVFDSNNHPCFSAQVQVLEQDVMGTTDINGRFRLSRLPRGKHTLVISKEGFETIEMPVDFTQRTQVVYVRLMSQKTLLEQVEQAMDLYQWNQAREFLERAQTINDSACHFLLVAGTFYTLQGDHNLALQNFLTLWNRGYRDSNLMLMIAHVYEHGLQDEKNALLWLNRYLQIDDSQKIRERRNLLASSLDDSP